MTDSKLQAKWIVNLIDNYTYDSYEISVIREDFSHGIKSYGWFGDNKLPIGVCNNFRADIKLKEQVWNIQLKAAKELAAKMNLNEFGISDEVKVIRISPFSIFLN